MSDSNSIRGETVQELQITVEDFSPRLSRKLILD